MSHFGMTRIAASLVLVTAGVVGHTFPATASVASNPTRSTAARARPAIAVGNAHSCAASADGTVKCWGLNSKGELGNGSTTSSTTPVVVTSTPRAPRRVRSRRASITLAPWRPTAPRPVGASTTTASWGTAR